MLEIDKSRAVVQLFENSQGLQMSESRARFLGHAQELAVSRDMLGRVFDGMGNPRDGGEPVLPEKTTAWATPATGESPCSPKR